MGEGRFNAETLSDSQNIQTSILILFFFFLLVCFTLVEMPVFVERREKTILLFAVREKTSVSETF